MKRKFSLYRFVSQLLRLPIAGPVFKIYAPRRRWKPGASEPKRLRVLIANLMPSLGDTICYMPLAEVLDDALPGVEITWLADSAMAGLVAMHPNVDRVLTIRTPDNILKRIPTVKMYYRLYTLMRTIMAFDLSHRFDIAIIPRGGVDPALSAQGVWMLNLQRSTGYSHVVEPQDADHNFGDQLITELITRITSLHETSRALYLLETSGLVPDATRRWNVNMQIRGVRAIAETVDAESLFIKTGISRDIPFITVTPGAGAPRKTWPGQKFHELCARILAKTDCQVVLTGTSGEISLAAAVAAGLGDRVINIAGKLSLVELIALLGHATAFVGNDSGAGHIAGPMGVPVISLHVQPKDSDPHHIHAPEHYRPVGPNVTIVQPDRFLAPCEGRCESNTVHCLDQITVDEVWNALARALPPHILRG
jgi:ADP-heptose:LPS heptosyltransferase